MIIQTTYRIVDINNDVNNDIELEVSHEIDSRFVKITEIIQGKKSNEIVLTYEQVKSLLTVLKHLVPEINNKD